MNIKVISLDYDSLLKENIRLRAENENLENIIKGLQGRIKDDEAFYLGTEKFNNDIDWKAFSAKRSK
jgi:transposase-like protein